MNFKIIENTKKFIKYNRTFFKFSKKWFVPCLNFTLLANFASSFFFYFNKRYL